MSVVNLLLGFYRPVLIVSHDAEAARSADEVVRLVDGKIEQSQPTRTTELTPQSMPAPP